MFQLDKTFFYKKYFGDLLIILILISYDVFLTVIEIMVYSLPKIFSMRYRLSIYFIVFLLFSCTTSQAQIVNEHQCDYPLDVKDMVYNFDNLEIDEQKSLNEKIAFLERRIEKEQNPDRLFHLKYLVFYYKHSDSEKFNAFDFGNRFILEHKELGCIHLQNAIIKHTDYLLQQGKYKDLLNIIHSIEFHDTKLPKKFVYYRFANCYYILKRYESAITYFQFIIDLGEPLRKGPEYLIWADKGSLANNIGLAYQHLGNKEQAEKYFHQAINYWIKQEKSIFTKNDNDLEKARYIFFKKILENNLLELKLKEEHTDSLIFENLKEEYQIIIDNKLYRPDLPIYLKLSEFAFASKHIAEASLYLDSARVFIDDLGYKNRDIKLKMRYDLLHLKEVLLKNNLDRHVNTLNDLDTLLDLYDDRNRELYLKTSVFDLESSTRTLKQNSDRIEKEMKLRKQILFFAILTLVLLVIAIWSILVQLKARKKINEQNVTITKALNNSEMLLKEIHHRVKNNLQLVASIAYIEYMQKGEQFEFRSFEKKIYSLALVHRLLYSSDDLTQLNVRAYLGELLEHLQSSSNAVFDYSLEIEDIHLSLNKAIAFGLLTNELVLNTIKHCNPKNGEKKTIDIKLYLKTQWIMEYRDNGEDQDKDNSNDDETLGQSLIQLLVDNLDGKSEVSMKDGYQIKIKFKNLKEDK